MNERQLSTSLDHNSLGTDTAGTDVLNMQCSSDTTTTGGGKYCSTGSEASSNSAGSNQSKEYFTIGNRFDPSGLSSLLNDVIRDDDDDDNDNNDHSNENDILQNMTTLSRKRPGGMLPTKSFNTYAAHKEMTLGKSNSKHGNQNSSGIINAYVNNSNGGASGNGGGGGNNTVRYSNYSNLLHSNGSIRSLKGQQRTSFAFSMRTNLDQDL
jgi:hypothetical protein